MRYEHSIAQSAEFLRLALKRMMQQQAGLLLHHPFQGQPQKLGALRDAVFVPHVDGSKGLFSVARLSIARLVYFSGVAGLFLRRWRASGCGTAGSSTATGSIEIRAGQTTGAEKEYQILQIRLVIGWHALSQPS